MAGDSLEHGDDQKEGGGHENRVNKVVLHDFYRIMPLKGSGFCFETKNFNNFIDLARAAFHMLNRVRLTFVKKTN